MADVPSAMPRLPFTCLAVLSMCLVADRPASACDCLLAESACKAFGGAEVVFAGRVLSTGDGLSVDGAPAGRVEFAVVEPFRGVTSPHVTVANGPGTCAARFTVGETYLVYAQKRGGSRPPVTNRCTRTAPLARAQADVTYARGMAGLAPDTPGTLKGSVRQTDRRRGKRPLAGAPARGITVVATGPAGSVRSVSDQSGAFVMTNLPPGTYTVRANVPRGFVAGSPVQVDVRDPQGCGVVTLWVRRRS